MPTTGLKVDLKALEGLSASERELVAAELEVVEKAFKENPLLGFHPHAKQVDFLKPPHPPLRAFFGGNRSGKTTATMVDTIIQCCDDEVIPEHLKPFKRWSPPFYCRVVTPDLTRTLDGVVLQKYREWCPRGQMKGNRFDAAWDKQQVSLRFKNESWIQFMSNDQDVDKFGGAALHRVVYDEEPREDIRRECLMRLIDYNGEELFGMTPLNGMSWTYDEIFEPWEKGELAEGRVVVVDMEDNPHLSAEALQRILSNFSGEEREARKSGRFVHFAGLVYPAFSKARHVIPTPSELPDGAEVFEAIDPGIRHMCAVVFAYLDYSDDMVVFDEIALQGKTIKEVCTAIRGVREKWDFKPHWSVIDPAARNRSSQTGQTDQAAFSEHGINTIPGQNAVPFGINAVRQRLDADKLKVAAHCQELRAEFKRYRWASNSRTEDEPREKPVKRDDHMLDALRYLCAQRPLVPERERIEPSTTYKDRLLRHSIKQLSRLKKVPQHDSGPGIFS